MSKKISSRAMLIMMVMLLALTPLSPFSEILVGEAEASGSSRHIYTFSDGSVENIALFQGGADKTTKVAIPKGAEVLDVQGESNEIVTGVAIGLGNTMTVGLSTTLVFPGSVAFNGGDADEAVSGITTDLGESADADELVTAAGVVDYVNGQVSGNSNLTIQDDASGIGTIALGSENLGTRPA